MIGQLQAASLGAKLLMLGAVVVLLLGAGFAGGLRWQAGEVAQAEAKAATATSERDHWKARAEGLADAVVQQKAANDKRKQAAEQAQREALAAEHRANAAAEDFIEAAKQARIAIERAKGDPECRATLERTTCAALY